MKGAVRRKGYGFTLIELVVVMAMLSLVMLGLMSAMRTFVLTADRVDERIALLGSQRIAAQFVHNVLGSAIIPGRVAGGETARLPPMLGGSSQLEWIGVMPARYGVGGLYRFRLRQGDDPGAAGVLLEFMPYLPVSAMVDWSAAEARLLFAGADSLAFFYEDGLVSPADVWLPEWVSPDRLPARVRVRIHVPAIAWPDLVIPILNPPVPSAGGGLGGFSVGGGGER